MFATPLHHLTLSRLCATVSTDASKSPKSTKGRPVGASVWTSTVLGARENSECGVAFVGEMSTETAQPQDQDRATTTRGSTLHGADRIAPLSNASIVAREASHAISSAAKNDVGRATPWPAIS